jgi:glycosyltransferase involved in cell wall biosynthesis
MKVLRIIARLNVGGPARHVIWLTSALNDDEFRSELVAGTVPPGEEDMEYFAAENAVRPFYVRAMSRELSLKDVVSLLRIYRKFRAERPDIVHTHTAKAGTVGRAAALLYRWTTWGTLVGRPRKVKVVHTFHGHVFHSYYGRARTGFFLMVERFLARYATDRIVVLSEQQLDEINKTFRVGRRERFEVIPLGIETEAFASAMGDREFVRRELGFGKNDIVAGYVGRLTEIKDIPLLLRAAALCVAETPDVRFAIVGDGHLRESLEAQAASLGPGPRIDFLGNRGDVARIYAGLDMVVLTSLNEGTPLSLIEAMAAGKPVISTAVGGVPGMIGPAVDGRDGFSVCERGLLVSSRRPEDLKNGLIYLAKNERLRAEIAARAQRYVESNYSRQRLVADIRRLYRQLAAEN